MVSSNCKTGCSQEFGKRVMMKNLVKTALLIGLALGLASCGETASREVVATPVASAAPLKSTPAVADDPFVASGPLVVEHQVDVTAQHDGVVATVSAEPGTRVRQGQLLGTLDDRQISADLEAARAKTRSTDADLKNWQAETKVLQADLDRAQKMWDAKIISQEQLDHVRFQAESDQWNVQRTQQLLVNAQEVQRSLELELEKTRVTAPFAGIVARRYVRVGQQVAKGDRLFWVTAEAPLQVRFTLPERFFGHVKKGAQLELTTPDLPDSKFAARVIEVSPVVDSSSATIEVLAELVGKTGDLRPGMSSNILIPNSR
jgi:RND family efflux transporter MFP subunit